MTIFVYGGSGSGSDLMDTARETARLGRPVEREGVYLIGLRGLSVRDDLTRSGSTPGGYLKLAFYPEVGNVPQNERDAGRVISLEQFRALMRW